MGKHLLVVGPPGGKRLVVVGADQHSREEAQPGGPVDQGREQQQAVQVAQQGMVFAVEVG